jgi:glycosyltransferase involved in cell wall biosynthesis
MFHATKNNKKKFKIKLIGRDFLNWSTDKDYFFTKNIIERSNDFNITNNIFSSDILYSTWWNILNSKRYRFFTPFKFVVATITNDPTISTKDFDYLANKVNLWVIANKKQEDFLINRNICKNDILFNPFRVSTSLFYKRDLTKAQLCNKLNISFEKIKGKTIVASIQRDSLGSDLTKPKFQKDPDLFVKCVSRIKDCLVLLAGPRRHYIRNLLNKKKIPYIFIGKETDVDDISLNNLNEDVVNLIYNLADIYIVSSSNEGGPKSIFESMLTKTPIFSTDVGMAPDFLPSSLIYKDEIDFELKYNKLTTTELSRLTSQNYELAIKTCNKDATELRINNILKEISERIS